MTDFVWIIKNGDLNATQEFVEKKSLDINEEISGRFPIHHAADYGQLEIIKYLHSKGANINKADKHGITALLAATWEGHTDCVRYLVSMGANKQITAPDGRSIFECAPTDEIKSLLK
ncbi:myotrophin-like [Argonauta hians]